MTKTVRFASSRVFKKSSSGRKKPSLDNVLEDLAGKSPSSANCTLIRKPSGEEADEDLGATAIFQYGDQTLIRDKSFYITTPDGVKAEETSLLAGKGEVVHLWFLHNRIPHTVDCRVLGRFRFPDEVRDELHPRVPMGYALRPVGPVRKIILAIRPKAWQTHPRFMMRPRSCRSSC